MPRRATPRKAIRWSTGTPAAGILLAEATHQIFAHSLDGIVITDPDTLIVEANPAYCAIVGYPREELIGRPVGIIKSGRTQPDVYRDMWEKLNASGKWLGELVNRRKNGEEWYCYLSITRLTGPDGRLIGYAAIVRDVTERERAERLLADKVRELAATQEVTVKTLALLAEHKDPDISGHLERIEIYTRLLAETLADLPKYRGRLTRAFVNEVVASSVLHDVGKVGIPEGILFKPGRLSPEEYQVMQLHPQIGGNILGTADRRLREVLGVDKTFMTVAAAIARHHHERWDGNGYPDRLRGEAIPLSARVVAVADVYDALTSRRVYKPAWSHAHSRRAIADGAGKQFDPDVVEAFLEREREFDAVRRRFAEAREEAR